MRFSFSAKTIFRSVIAIGFVILIGMFIFNQELFDKAEQEETPSPSPSPSTQAGKKVQLEMTRMVSRKERVKFWELEAEVIYVSEETKKGEARAIKCTFYDEMEKPSMQFVADGADIDMANQSLFFKGKVNGTMASGEQIEVQRLVWDGQKKKVFGYDSVKITRGKSVLKGKDMVGDPQKRYVEIIGNVDVTWLNEEKGKN